MSINIRDKLIQEDWFIERWNKIKINFTGSYNKDNKLIIDFITASFTMTIAIAFWNGALIISDCKFILLLQITTSYISIIIS